MLTVSLTSVPPRFPGLGRVVESLQNQSVPLRIIVQLPERYHRFPEWDGNLPALPPGVEVRRTPLDFGPATKLFPLLGPGSDPTRDILIADDDNLYAPDWAAGFLNARQMHPQAAIAASAFPVRRLGLTPAPSDEHRIAQGFAGILLRPGMLHGDVLQMPDRFRAVDDIWISGQLAAAGTNILHMPKVRTSVRPVTADLAPLQSESHFGLSRAEANRAAAVYLRERYGIWS
ncbi:MAG: hypothetical protein AAFX00_11280 [Pseudomonadota bacterium]